MTLSKNNHRLPKKGKVTNQVLIDMLDQAYSKRSWHGASLAGSIRGLKVKQALWRPGKKCHNIWEIVLHSAYWKYIVWRKLAIKPDSTFVISGSNWFEPPDNPDEKEWKKAKAILGKYHRLLQQEVQEIQPSELYQQAPGSHWRFIDMILGIAAHDLYHAGQIQAYKRLQK
jgi:hypothetical protein